MEINELKKPEESQNKWKKGNNKKSKGRFRGTWVAQSVKHPTLDLHSDLDLRAVSLSLALGSTLGMEPIKKRQGCLGGSVS